MVDELSVIWGRVFAASVKVLGSTSEAAAVDAAAGVDSFKAFLDGAPATDDGIAVWIEMYVESVRAGDNTQVAAFLATSAVSVFSAAMADKYDRRT